MFRAWRFSFALTLSFQFTICFQLPLHQEVRWFTTLLRVSRVLHLLTPGHPPPPPPATLTTRSASSSQGSTRYVQRKQSRPHQCAARPTRLQAVLNSDAVEFGGLGRIDERVGRGQLCLPFRLSVTRRRWSTSPPRSHSTTGNSWLCVQAPAAIMKPLTARRRSNSMMVYAPCRTCAVCCPGTHAVAA